MAPPNDDFDDDFEDAKQRENEDDLQLSRETFRDLIVAPSDWTIESIVGLVGKQIDLQPDFQRRGVWSSTHKINFIESLFLNIPIPQILLAAKKNDRNAFIVLDGKQRLLTIKQFLDGAFEDMRPFVLKNLRVIDELEGKSWADLKEDAEWSGLLLNQTIRTTVMRGWKKEDALYEIFLRLNSGSIKLSPMELRMSLHPGEFLRFVIVWTEKMRELHALLKLRRPDSRMSDAELVVRFLAFQQSEIPYKGSLKVFLDEVSQLLNKQFSDAAVRAQVEGYLFEMEQAITAARKVFDGEAARKWNGNAYETRFNRAVFDVQIGSLADRRVRAWALQDPIHFRGAFQELCDRDRDFVRSIETTTKSRDAVRTRFQTWYSKVQEFSGIALVPPRVE